MMFWKQLVVVASVLLLSSTAATASGYGDRTRIPYQQYLGSGASLPRPEKSLVVLDASILTILQTVNSRHGICKYSLVRCPLACCGTDTLSAVINSSSYQSYSYDPPNLTLTDGGNTISHQLEIDNPIQRIPAIYEKWLSRTGRTAVVLGTFRSSVLNAPSKVNSVEQVWVDKEVVATSSGGISGKMSTLGIAANGRTGYCVSGLVLLAFIMARL
jgi:hypothetical protein